jgi:hypothetical protein
LFYFEPKPKFLEHLFITLPLAVASLCFRLRGCFKAQSEENGKHCKPLTLWSRL